MNKESFNKVYNAIRKTACVFYPKMKILESKDSEQALEETASLFTARISMVEPYKIMPSLILDNEGKIQSLVQLMMLEEKLWITSYSEKDQLSHIFNDYFQKTNHDYIDMSEQYKIIGIEGPRSWKILKKIFGLEVIGLSPLHIMDAEVDDCEVVIARTGFSGETSYRIFVNIENYELIKQKIQNAKVEDTKEIPENDKILDDLITVVSAEMRIPVLDYGVIQKGDSPVENELRWLLKASETDYKGKAAVTEELSSFKKRSVGFVFQENTPIDNLSEIKNSPVLLSDQEIGVIKYINYSPTLENHFGYILFDREWGYANIDDYHIQFNDVKIPIQTRSTSFIIPLSNEEENQM